MIFCYSLLYVYSCVCKSITYRFQFIFQIKMFDDGTLKLLTCVTFHNKSCIWLKFECLYTDSLTHSLTIVQPHKSFPAFYGPQSSLPCSNGPSTGPYPETHQSKPHRPINLSKIHFNIVHPPTWASFFVASTPKSYSSPAFVLHAMAISTSLTSSFSEYERYVIILPFHISQGV
jgi:hypothetical protein